MTPAMDTTDTGQDSAIGPSCRFPTTQWSVILEAGGTQDGQQALEQLCRTYWYPLYAFARRNGASPAEAQDLTQGFFAELLRGHLVGKADPKAGKFRSFLLTAFKHFVSNQEARAGAQKRGGDVELFAIDGASGEAWFGREPATMEEAEVLFERSWASKVLDQALDRLAGEFKAAGKAEVFKELSPLLQGDRAEGGYTSLAHKLGVVEGTIKWTVSRMRARYRALIRSVIAETVATPTEAEEEVQHLITVLRY